MVHSSRSWAQTVGEDVVIYTYVQTNVGNFAYRHKGNITTTATAVAADLTNNQVEALF